MDVSDGIGRDAHRMARACGTGAPGGRVEDGRARTLTPWVADTWVAEVARPLGPVAALAGVAPEALVLAGGEDYGVVGLAWPETALPAGFTRIGRMLPAGAEPPAGHRPLPERGWDHFGG